jgi:hypothetical protein
MHARVRCGTGEAHQPKVKEEAFVLVAQANATVWGLDVAMDEAEVMHLMDGIEDLHAEHNGCLQWEPLFWRQAAHVGQIFTKQLHHEVVTWCVCTHLHEACDGRAWLQTTQHILLVQQHRTLLSFAGHLHCHMRVPPIGATLLLQIGRLVNLRKCALSDAPPDTPARPEDLPDRALAAVAVVGLSVAIHAGERAGIRECRHGQEKEEGWSHSR